MLLPLMKSGSIAAVLTYEKIFHPNTLTLEFSIINGSQNWMIARLVCGGQVPAVSNLVVKSVSQPLLVPCISLCNRYCSFHGSPSNKCCMWPSANHSPLFADKLPSHHDYIVSSPPAPPLVIFYITSILWCFGRPGAEVSWLATSVPL